MNLPIGPLVLGATQARNAYVGGQRETQHDDLAQALMLRKMKQDEQQQSLRDALTRSEIGQHSATAEHMGAQTDALHHPSADITGHVESQDGRLWAIHKDGTRSEIKERGQVPTITPPSITSAGVVPSSENGPTGDIDLSRPDHVPEGPQQPQQLPIGPLTQAPKFGPRPPAPVAKQHVVDPVSGKVTFFDPTNPPTNLNVTPAPRQSDGIAENRRQNLINSVRGQFNSDQTVKDAQQVQTAYAKIKSAATGTHTPTNDMSLIYGMMKMQDPNSTVREGEYATAANAANWPARVRDSYNLTVKNHLLPDETRAQFLQTAGQIAQAQRTAFQSTTQRYSEIAKRQGIDPRDVVYDPYDGLFDETPTKPAKPGAKKGGVLQRFGIPPGGDE